MNVDNGARQSKEYNMGLFDAIAGLQKMAEDPELGKSAMALGNAAQQIPTLLTDIRDCLHSLISLHQDDQVERAKSLQLISGQIDVINARLVEISLGLDTLADPIKRPPFSVHDVEAAMSGNWPSVTNLLPAEESRKASDLADDLHAMMTKTKGE